MKRHMITHSGVKLYLCADCEKTFFNGLSTQELTLERNHISVPNVTDLFLSLVVLGNTRELTLKRNYLPASIVKDLFLDLTA